MLEFKLLLLLMVTNGTPIIAHKLFGCRLEAPLDAGMQCFDGRPLFGSSKTIRGLFLAIVVTTLCAPLFGFSWGIGLIIGSTAMMGDLLSSFTKRRLGFAPSSMVLGLDQIPESLLPLLACMIPLRLSWQSIAIVVVVFFASELLCSVVLYRLRIRQRPY